MAILCTRGLQEELAIHVRLGQEQWGVSRAEIALKPDEDSTGWLKLSDGGELSVHRPPRVLLRLMAESLLPKPSRRTMRVQWTPAPSMLLPAWRKTTLWR